MKAFQAYAAGGFNVTAETPRKAAAAFFAAFPVKRKCNIIEGDAGNGFFTITYSLRRDGTRPMSIKNVTKSSVTTLSDFSVDGAS